MKPHAARLQTASESLASASILRAQRAQRRRSAAMLGLAAAVAVVGLLLELQGVWAQDAPAQPGPTLFVGNVDSDAFPTVAVQLYATDGAGLPLTTLTANDVFVAEDGRELAADDLQVTPVTAAPLNLVIALNRATPPADWEALVTGVDALLHQLAPGDRVGLVAYNEGAETLTPLTDDLEAVRATLVNAQPGGTDSAFYIALNQALGLFEDVEGRRALLVVSDRGNTVADGGDATVLPALIEAARSGEIVGNVIGFGPAGADPDFLQLAQGTGGRALAVSTAADVTPHLAALPALLRQGFRIAYTSTIAATDDDHLLSVALRPAPGAPIEGATITRAFVARIRPVDVQITAPADGQKVSGAIAVTFDAATPAPVARVTFTLDTGEVITSTQTALGGIIWNSAGAPPGERRLKVTVEDRAGNVGEDEVGLLVAPPLTLAVQTSAPEVTAGETTVVTAFVTSTLGGANVEAFVGRTQVGVKANQQGAVPFALDTKLFPPGRYSIVVRAADAQGNVATDNAQVLSIVAAANANMTPTSLWASLSAWFARNWLWLVGALLGLVALWLLWLLVRALWRSVQAQRRRRRAERARIVPQARMLITNTGNVRTPYRLRALAPNGDLRITFLLDGMPLRPPLVASEVRAPLITGANAGNGQAAAGARPALAPAPAPAAQPALATPDVSAAYQGAAQAADVGGRLLNSLGKLVPGAAGAQFRRAGSAVVAQQTTVARAQGQVQTTMHTARDVGYYGQQVVPVGAAAQGTQAAYADVQSPPAPPPASAAAPAPRPASVDPAFELQGDVSALPRTSVTSAWVETPPLAPGETIGIDIHVAPLEARRAGAMANFSVTSGPAAAAGADLITDAVSVRLK